MVHVCLFSKEALCFSMGFVWTPLRTLPTSAPLSSWVRFLLFSPHSSRIFFKDSVVRIAGMVVAIALIGVVAMVVKTKTKIRPAARRRVGFQL